MPRTQLHGTTRAAERIVALLIAPVLASPLGGTQVRIGVRPLVEQIPHLERYDRPSQQTGTHTDITDRKNT